MVESLDTAVLGSVTLMSPAGSMLVLLGGGGGGGGGSVKALAGKTFNKRTQLYVINGNLNSQSYIDEILRPIAMPFLRRI